MNADAQPRKGNNLVSNVVRRLCHAEKREILATTTHSDQKGDLL